MTTSTKICYKFLSASIEKFTKSNTTNPNRPKNNTKFELYSGNIFTQFRLIEKLARILFVGCSSSFIFISGSVSAPITCGHFWWQPPLPLNRVIYLAFTLLRHSFLYWFFVCLKQSIVPTYSRSYLHQSHLAHWAWNRIKIVALNYFMECLSAFLELGTSKFGISK